MEKIDKQAVLDLFVNGGTTKSMIYERINTLPTTPDFPTLPKSTKLIHVLEQSKIPYTENGATVIINQQINFAEIYDLGRLENKEI